MVMQILRKASYILPDKLYIGMKFKKNIGKWPNFKDPKTFNEKIQWLKLNDKNPEYIKMVDKHEAKKYAAGMIGEEYILPEYGVWNSFDEIDFDLLPEQFVLKTTHDCAGVVICKDKASFDREKAKKFLNNHLNSNYFYEGREWPYKSIKPRIIAEKYIEDGNNGLNDYKVFNFNGEPDLIQVDFDRFTEHKKNLYTTDWELCDFSFNYPSHPEIEILKPTNLDEMLRISRILAKDIPYVRIDFYEVKDKLYLGEITFYPASGFGKFNPEKYDRILGDKINLHKK